MKAIQAFSLALLVTCCSSEKPIEPRDVVLSYGESTRVTAKIREDGTFETSKSFELESVVFSGTVSKQDEKYLIDLAFSREIESDSSSTELETAILLMVEESVVVAGVNDEVYSVALE